MQVKALPSIFTMLKPQKTSPNSRTWISAFSFPVGTIPFCHQKKSSSLLPALVALRPRSPFSHPAVFIVIEVHDCNNRHNNCDWQLTQAPDIWTERSRRRRNADFLVPNHRGQNREADTGHHSGSCGQTAHHPSRQTADDTLQAFNAEGDS